MIENIRKQTQTQVNYEYKFLDWDTNYFGVKSARVILKNKIDRDEWVKVRNLILDNEFIVIDNVNNDSVNNFFISNLSGIFLTDINFQFTKEIKESNINQSSAYEKNITIHNNMPWNKQVIEISKNSFKFSRFFNDPFLDKKRSRNIYSHWVESAFLDENRYFLYYKTDQYILGYILFRIDSQNKKVIIELISVKEGKENKSIGTRMVNALECFLLREFTDTTIIQVGTQSNNIKAINFYEKNGFRVKEIRSIYHYWPNFILNNMHTVVNEEVAISNA
jgi:ribosomal protein S18 acetylase RimI-like enzyme